jgi:hypothetical protein
MVRCLFPLLTLLIAAGPPGSPPGRTATLEPRYDEDNEENKLFWNATPLGELRIQLPSGVAGPVLGAFDPIPEQVGRGFFIDIEPVPEGEKVDQAWQLVEVKNPHPGQLQVRFSLPYVSSHSPHGSFHMGIDNTAAWRHFQGQQGKYFRIQVRPALA